MIARFGVLMGTRLVGYWSAGRVGRGKRGEIELSFVEDVDGQKVGDRFGKGRGSMVCGIERGRVVKTKVEAVEVDECFHPGQHGSRTASRG
jgi:hypothetical protein